MHICLQKSSINLNLWTATHGLGEGWKGSYIVWTYFFLVRSYISICDICHIHISNPSMNRLLGHELVSGVPLLMREILTNTGKLGLRLLEDLTALAAGGSVCAI